MGGGTASTVETLALVPIFRWLIDASSRGSIIILQKSTAASRVYFSNSFFSPIFQNGSLTVDGSISKIAK